MLIRRVYITGTRRGLGRHLAEIYPPAVSLAECDVFINCKHDGFTQVRLLYEAAKMGKRIINIGSISADGIRRCNQYAVEKAALDKANEQLFYDGVQTSIVRFGYFDSERVRHIDQPKMGLDYCASVIAWVLDQPHIVKEVTVWAS